MSTKYRPRHIKLQVKDRKRARGGGVVDVERVDMSARRGMRAVDVTGSSGSPDDTIDLVTEYLAELQRILG